MNILPIPDELPFVNLLIERKIYSVGTKCSIKGCIRNATHEVYRKGFTFYNHDKAGILTTQSNNCPFICEKHAIENENQKVKRNSQNSQFDQGFEYKLIDELGYVTYKNIIDAFPNIYLESSKLSSNLIITLNNFNSELTEYI